MGQTSANLPDYLMGLFPLTALSKNCRSPSIYGIALFLPLMFLKISLITCQYCAIM